LLSVSSTVIAPVFTKSLTLVLRHDIVASAGATMMWFRIVGTVVGLVCAGCACDPPVAEMRAFLADQANQTCVEDDDCTVGLTGCANLGFEYCGQVALNKTAEQSSTWRDLVEESNDCESGCTQCLGALGVACTNGRCAPPR